MIPVDTLADSRERVRKAWEDHRFREGLHFQEERMFADLVGATRSGRVLDIGVGNGRMPRLLRDGSDARFFGVDITDRCRESPTLNVIADTRALPFPDAYFDAVYSLGVVEHFPETARALQEHVRVLKPGGWLFFTVPHLSLATVWKYWQFFSSRAYRHTTFEAQRGRNLSLGYVRRIVEALPVEVRTLEPCGVRPPRSRGRHLLKALLPGAWQQPHIYCVAQKRRATA